MKPQRYNRFMLYHNPTQSNTTQHNYKHTQEQMVWHMYDYGCINIKNYE